MASQLMETVKAALEADVSKVSDQFAHHPAFAAFVDRFSEELADKAFKEFANSLSYSVMEDDRLPIIEATFPLLMKRMIEHAGRYQQYMKDQEG